MFVKNGKEHGKGWGWSVLSRKFWSGAKTGPGGPLLGAKTGPPGPDIDAIIGPPVPKVVRPSIKCQAHSENATELSESVKGAIWMHAWSQ